MATALESIYMRSPCTTDQAGRQPPSIIVLCSATSSTLGIASPTPANPTPIKTPQSTPQEKTPGIQTPATVTPQIAAMAQALADKQFFLLEQPAKNTPPRRKGPEDLPVEYYTPRPYTLGPHDEPGYVPLRVSKNGTEKCKENHREQKQKKGEREGLVNNNATFKTQHGAAEYVSKKINSKSISENREYGGMIYQNEDGTYSYTGPIRGSIDGVNPGGLTSDTL